MSRAGNVTRFSWSSQLDRNSCDVLNNKVCRGAETFKSSPEVTFTKSERVKVSEARGQAFYALDRRKRLPPSADVTVQSHDGRREGGITIRCTGL